MRRTAVSLVLAALLGATFAAPAHASPQRWSTCGRFVLVDTVSVPGAYWTRITGVSHVSPADAWAVGYAYGPDVQKRIVLRWDGWRWNSVALPRPPAGVTQTLQGVSALAADDVWVTGSRDDRPLALHWDGTAWHNTPQVAGMWGTLFGVAEAPGTNRLWAYGSEGWYAGTLIERWNGDAWRRARTPEMHTTNAAVLDLVAFPRTGFAVGGVGGGVTVALRLSQQGWVATAVPHVAETTLFGVDGARPGSVLAVGARDGRAQVIAWNGGWNVVKRLDRPSALSDIVATSAGPWTVGQWIGGDQSGSPFTMHRTTAGWVAEPPLDVGGSAWTGEIVGTPHDLWTFANDAGEGPNAYLFHRC